MAVVILREERPGHTITIQSLCFMLISTIDERGQGN